MAVMTDRERLVAALRRRGVDWLAPGDAHGAAMADDLLIASLATYDDPRLRQALMRKTGAGLASMHNPRRRGFLTGRESLESTGLRTWHAIGKVHNPLKFTLGDDSVYVIIKERGNARRDGNDFHHANSDAPQRRNADE